MGAWLETITDLTCLCSSAQPVREMACTCRVVDNGGEHQRQQTVLQQQLSICPKHKQLNITTNKKLFKNPTDLFYSATGTKHKVKCTFLFMCEKDTMTIWSGEVDE